MAALQQATVFKAMRQSLESESKTAKKQMRVFWLTILVFSVWQFLPEVRRSLNRRKLTSTVCLSVPLFSGSPLLGQH